MRILNRWTKIKRNGKCLHVFTWSLRLRGGRVVETLRRAYTGARGVYAVVVGRSSAVKIGSSSRLRVDFFVLFLFN